MIRSMFMRVNSECAHQLRPRPPARAVPTAATDNGVELPAIEPCSQRRRQAIFSDILDFRERVLVSHAQASARRGDVDRGTGFAPVYAGERLFLESPSRRTDAPTDAPRHGDRLSVIMRLPPRMGTSRTPPIGSPSRGPDARRPRARSGLLESHPLCRSTFRRA